MREIFDLLLVLINVCALQAETNLIPEELTIDLNHAILLLWYHSNLAYAAYILLLVFGIWFSLRFQKKRLEWNQPVELEQQKAERLKGFGGNFLSNKSNDSTLVVPTPNSTPLNNLVSTTDALKPKVLLVEDNAFVLHYLISFMKEQYQIEIAMNGAEGIQKAIEKMPDAIISDVMMPEIDGFELCETLKADARSSHIPIILLTAKVDLDARLEGLGKGANAYLSKPFHQEELLLILQNQIQIRQELQAKLEQIAVVRSKEGANVIDLSNGHTFLQKVRDLVEKDLSNTQFGMPQLIHGLQMSRSQIYKKVKALTGKSPSIYIRSIRLYRGKALLESSDMSISEVAYKVGFSSPPYFSKLFFEEFGCTPSETRKNLTSSNLNQT